MDRTVLRALERRNEISEYELARVRTRRASRDERGEDDVFIGRIYTDDASGRGQAGFTIPARERVDANAAVDAAVQRALAGTGPFWRLPPPSAPARVDVFDPQLGDSTVEASERLHNRISAAAREQASLRGTVRAQVVALDAEVQISTGFRGAYRATVATLRASTAARNDAAASLEWSLVRRREADLDIAALLDGAARAVNDLANASPTPAGTYDVVLSGAAIEGSAGDGFGLFAPLVAHADGAMARRGLARYLPGQPVFRPGATGDSLTIVSDGTLPFAPRSAPFGTGGEAVRRFELITDGIAAGLALAPKEAALRNAAPNGGARNLVVAAGSHAANQLRSPGERPLLEIAELTWLDADPSTGLLTGEIALAHLHDASGRRPVRGGLVRADTYVALSAAQLSSDTGAHGWYHGPNWIRLPGVAVLA